MSKPLPIIYSFARSGGTLVNQLLGVHPQCLVLSEVNPALSYKPLMEQAVDWLRLVNTDEAEELAQWPYRRLIELLHARASALGKQLIVRDWPTVNFLPGCAADVVASRRLEQALYLERAGVTQVPLVVSRRSTAVFASIRRNFQHLHDLEASVFADAYLAYAHAMRGLPVIHLESIRARPAAVIVEILRRFGLDTEGVEMLLQKFSSFRNCTGNTTLTNPGPSARATEVLAHETAAAPEEALSTEALRAMSQADRILGYE